MAHQKVNEACGPWQELIEVPAKAMLFGEYGVLQGGRVVVFLIDSIRMKIQFELHQRFNSESSVCRFESDFFNSPVVINADTLSRLALENSESEQRNLSCYLNGFADLLTTHTLRAQVIESFSPSLGFGSSSALLVAFQIALSTWTAGLEDKRGLLTPDYWQRLYDSLLLLQRKGSGYDVAVQSWAVAHQKVTSGGLLCFSNAGFHQHRFDPQVAEICLPDIDRRRLGCFVKTGVRSDTRRVLQSVAQKKWPAEFYLQQARWAQEFIAHPSAQTAQDLCRESASWARRFELLPPDPQALAFIDACERESISWKTMGAGHGDCLWVMAPKEQIKLMIADLGAPQLSVGFAFEEGV